METLAPPSVQAKDVDKIIAAVVKPTRTQSAVGHDSGVMMDTLKTLVRALGPILKLVRPVKRTPTSESSAAPDGDAEVIAHPSSNLFLTETQFRKIANFIMREAKVMLPIRLLSQVYYDLDLDDETTVARRLNCGIQVGAGVYPTMVVQVEMAPDNSKAYHRKLVLKAADWLLYTRCEVHAVVLVKYVRAGCRWTGSVEVYIRRVSDLRTRILNDDQKLAMIMRRGERAYLERPKWELELYLSDFIGQCDRPDGDSA